jgi:hypothetical protein
MSQVHNVTPVPVHSPMSRLGFLVVREAQKLHLVEEQKEVDLARGMTDQEWIAWIRAGKPGL